MEVRQLVAEEGREARNLIAFHVAVDTPVTRVSRKPPRSVPGNPAAASLRRAGAGAPSRLRSASAGRDKRAELQARYWALLFGNLQRAIGEIYTTVEAHENLSECQEVILVLENYTRDFKSLCEWFKLKWEYDNTPPPQRPQSLAWEVRKTDFVRPESRRTHSMKSSPSVSGKNSPSLSGHNTPSGKNSPSLSTGKSSPGSGKLSPRILGNSITSPKSNVEFFGAKGTVAAKMHSKVESKSLKDASSRLSDIKEKVVLDGDTTNPGKENTEKKPSKTESPNKCDVLVVEMGTAKEYPSATSPKPVVIKTSPKSVKVIQKRDNEVKVDEKFRPPTTNATSEDACINKQNCIEIVDNFTPNTNCDSIQDIPQPKSLQVNDILRHTDHKQETLLSRIDNITVGNFNNDTDTENINDIKPECPTDTEDKSIGETTTSLSAIAGIVANDQFEVLKNLEKENENMDSHDEQPLKSNASFESHEVESQKPEDTIKIEIKPQSTDGKNINTKPAYSQAAAKPKSISAKIEIKTAQKIVTSNLTRSKTVAEIKQNNRQVQAKRISNNRCSYPFNLTTGRPSLFDGTPGNNTKTNARNNINRVNLRLASGDAKLTKNEDLNKRGPLKRPSNIKIEGEVQEVKPKSNPNLEKLKDSDNYSSTDTIVTQIDRNDSSESLKTLVPDPEYQFYDDLFANSIEVLNVDDNADNDNDGWLTVKSRRLSRESKKQSKSHWANRFNQPSATASLPTLNMIESPKQENKPFISKSEIKPPKPTADSLTIENMDKPECIKIDDRDQVIVKDELETATVNKDIGENEPNDINIESQQEITDNTDKHQKTTKKLSKINIFNLKKPENKALKVISTVIVRQKSDVTGLKTRSSRNKSLAKICRIDKQKDKIKNRYDLTRNRLHSSLESLIPSGLSRSQESTENSFDFDRWKFEFKNSFDFLEDEDRLLNRSEYLKTADPVEMSEIALMTSEIEENERKISLALDFQSDVDQRKLCEEEDLLNRQIQELQQVSDVDLDTETDDTETDAEILCEDARTLGVECPALAALGPLAASLEDQYEPVLAGLSWAERVDTLATLEALVARYPGRAQQLHSKLSQGIRRRGSLQETLKRYQLKQARAEHQRLELQTERTKKIHQLLARVEDVKAAKNQLIEEKRLRMEQRLQKAAENRDQHLKDIVRKAHDEEEKLREIAFIKQLEAEHRRQDFLEQCRSHTARLRQMRRDRLRKLEQKAAREAAVGARRLALEAARRLHVSTLLERRRQRDARVVELRERTRQRRDTAARQKAADVKSRLVALAAAADADAAALRTRIRRKQDATRERHAEHLRAIRTRALQPTRQHTTSESQDVKQDEEHEAEVEEPEVSKEKLKAIRKKARKLKLKLLTAGQEYENRTKPQPISVQMMKNKMCRALSQLQHILSPLGLNTSNGDQPEEDRRKKSLSLESDCSEKKKKKRNPRKKQPEEDEGRYENKNVKGSKGNSICSSMSDVSRQSRNEVIVSSALDINSLDRCLNELYRILDKLDKCTMPVALLTPIEKDYSVMNSPEKALFRQLNGHRLLSQVLALAATQESTALSDTHHIQAKSIVTCVGGVLLSVGSCPLGAEDFFRSNGPVHASQLLLDALSSETDAKESALSRCLSDLLCSLLEAVLLSSKMTVLRIEASRAESKNHTGKETMEPSSEVVAACELRQRAHQLISYLCASGVCARGSGESGHLYRLLALCCELCAPLPCDQSGGERASAWQALRAALRPGLGGARAQLAALSVRATLPSALECARLLALLRAACERDHSLLQEAFGDGALEFRAAAARLLAAHAPGDREPPAQRHTGKNQPAREQRAREGEETEAMLLDLISVIGFFVVNNPKNQEAVCGGSGGVVRPLCGVPAGWLCGARHSAALLPTLAALAADAHAAECIAAELSLQVLEDYLASPEAQGIRLVQLIHEGRARQRATKK